MDVINWYLGLFKSTDDKVILAAIGTTFTIITFLLNFIFTKLFKNEMIGFLFKYCFQLLFKFWHIALIVILSSAVLNYSTDFRYLNGFMSIRFVGFNILLFYSLVFLIPLIRNAREKLAPINIAFYGSYLLKNNEKLTSEVSSDQLNQKITDTLDEIVINSYIYRNNLITIYNIQLPKIIPVLLGYKTLNKKIQGKVKQQKHLATLHFIEDSEKVKLHTVINVNRELLLNSEPIDNAKKIIDSISDYQELNNSQRIELIINVFLLQFSHMYVDHLLDEENYTQVHFILDDADKRIREIRSTFKGLEPSHQDEIRALINFWQSNTDRYRAVALLEQDEYTGAINNIFNAIELNPYYPYQNYNELRQDYIKKYGIELLDSSVDFAEMLELTEEYKAYNENLKIELCRQIKYPESTWHFIIVREIMRRNESSEIIELIESKLNSMDDQDPFQLMSKYEILKFLKKGEVKVNEIYNERIIECIEILKSILAIDPDFYLAHSQWGVLLLMKGIHFNNQQMINDGVEKMKKGTYVLTQLGFKLN